MTSASALNSTNPKTQTATCGGSLTAISGGATVTNGTATAALSASNRSGTSAWTATALRISGNAASTYQLSVTVVCANVAP